MASTELATAENDRGVQNTKSEDGYNKAVAIIESSSTEVGSKVDHAVTPMRDLIVLCVVFVLVFSAFIAIQNLQTSINQEGNVGLTSLICIYATFVPCCIFAPAIVSKIGVKWTLALGWTIHSLYTAANFYPTLATMIPTSILLGIMSGPIWTTQGHYVSQIAIRYADQKSSDRSTMLVKFNGIFWTFFAMSLVVGNVVSSAILYVYDNSTIDDTSGFCGKYDCPNSLLENTNNTNSSLTENPVPIRTIYILMGAFATLDIGGLLVTVIFLKPLKNTGVIDMKERLRSVGTQFLRVDVLLLTPLYTLIGYEQAIVLGEFTKSYITCGFGARDVGFIMATFGLCDGIACTLIGPLTAHVSRIAQLLFIMCGHTGLVVYLLFWRSDEGSIAILFVVAGCWGICDAEWQTHTNACIGERQAASTEAAFAMLNIFRSLGYAIAFAISQYLCIDAKLFILEGLILTAVCLYGVAEIRHRRKGVTQSSNGLKEVTGQNTDM